MAVDMQFAIPQGSLRGRHNDELVCDTDTLADQYCGGISAGTLGNKVHRDLPRVVSQPSESKLKDDPVCSQSRIYDRHRHIVATQGCLSLPEIRARKTWHLECPFCARKWPALQPQLVAAASVISYCSILPMHGGCTQVATLRNTRTISRHNAQSRRTGRQKLRG